MPPPLPLDTADQAPPQQAIEVPITDAHTLFNSFTSFLTVSIHTILYYRGIYPRPTFLSAKAFNLPVHQSRHPKVCTWINDAVDAVMAQVAKGSVDRVAVVIHSPPNQQLAPGTVLERWMFDVSRFPSWPGGIEAIKNFRGDGGEEQHDNEDDNASGEDTNGDIAAEGVTVDNNASAPINWADVDEHLRGAVRRIAYAGEKMDTLPEGCTFTVAVELRDDAQAPIGHPQPWIPTQPRGGHPHGAHRQQREIHASTTPIRSVGAGPLFFECWVEEGKSKDALRGSHS